MCVNTKAVGRTVLKWTQSEVVRESAIRQRSCYGMKDSRFCGSAYIYQVTRTPLKISEQEWDSVVF